MPPRNNAIADYVNDWQLLLTALIANASDLQPLEPWRQQLEIRLNEVQGFSSQEKASRAERQLSTQRRRSALTEGKELASRLRSGVKLTYGGKTEKLVEFGVAPIRPRKAATKQPKPVDPSNRS